jgi:hypothetical protein
MLSNRVTSIFLIVFITLGVSTAAQDVESRPRVEPSGGEGDAPQEVQARRVEADPRVVFMAPVEITPGDPASARTVSGVELFGTIGGFISGRHGLTRVTLRPAEGSRQQFLASDIDELVIEPGTLSRIGMVREATSTVRKIRRDDLWARIDHDVVVFHRVAWPKPSDARLLQLVNPGFASRIRVYHLISATSGTWTIAGVPVAGGESKAFAVIKDGGEPMRVDRRHYERRDFDLLFGDCPEMLQGAAASNRNFHRFAQHTFVYDQLCGKQE